MISATPERPPNAPGAAPAPRDAFAWRFALRASGWTSITIGALALLAWACGEQDYLQIDQSRPPLHYNGALGFLVWGWAYLALLRGRNRSARVLGSVLVVLGAVALGASAPGTGVRLDRWAFVPAPYSFPFAPAGISPVLGLVFVLAGTAVFLKARTCAAPFSLRSGTLIGVVLALGSVALAVAPASAHPGGESILGMFGAAGAGLVLLMIPFRTRTPTFVLGHALPLLVGLIGSALTVALWVAMKAEQDQRVARQVQFEGEHVRTLVTERLPHEVTRIADLAERWSDARPEQLRSDLESYAYQTTGCLGVLRIDERGRVEWIDPIVQKRRGNTADLGGGAALAEAVRTGQVAVIRPPRSCWSGARVLLVFAPHRAKAPGGGLISVIEVQEFFANNIVNSSVANGYAVTLSENDEVLFVRTGTHREAPNRWTQNLPIEFRGHRWRLAVWPTQDALTRENLSLPKLALLVGLFTTALLALAVHLAQTARRRTFALEIEMRERKLAEQALRQSEEKYRTLIENLGQGIFLQDGECRYVAANVQFCRSVGRTEAQIVGATDADLFDPERAAKYSDEARTVLAEGRSVEAEAEVLVGGRRTCVRRVLTPVRDAAGHTTGVLGICWDVTEQRQLEAHVHQASKMDAIGQLAGGIAHDFNNLLTVILGNLELMLSELSPEHPDYELAVSARSAAVRAAALTQRLLGFSRRHQLDWRPTDLNGVVNEVVALLHRTIDPLTRIEARLAPDLWAVQGEPTQLNQVLMNLCINARDAIGGSGLISIETARVTANEALRAKVPNARGEFVRLRVTDTGDGMTPEVKARIYEPFFTTKEVGKGTGLGLAMVFAIVRQHKGWIDCVSEVGAGTRFDVYLPRAENQKLLDSAKHTPLASRTGKETILVVDDEELIRQLSTATLQSRGYSVLQAADGQQAVDLYAREKDRIDLVILDLTMPVLSGHEAFRQLLALNPRVRVLFVSGYSAEQLSDLEQKMMAGFVKKPYRPNDLILAVEEALPRVGGSRQEQSAAVPV